MSLSRPNLKNVIFKQYRFKLKSYHRMFSTLVFLHIISILFSLIGGNSSGVGTDHVWVHVKFYTADTVIGFTILWILVNGILLTTRAYREEDFTFVTTRMSSHCANGLFIITAGIIAGLTSVGAGFVVKVIVRYTLTGSYILAPEVNLSLQTLLAGFIATTLFMILFGMLGYLIGMFVQMHASMIFILPALIVGFFMFVASTGYEDAYIQLIAFYSAEPSIIKLLFKVSATVVMLFGLTTLFSNRLEVRTT